MRSQSFRNFAIDVNKIIDKYALCRVLGSTFFQTIAILVTVSIQTPIFIAIFIPIMAIYYGIQVNNQ